MMLTSIVVEKLFGTGKLLSGTIIMVCTGGATLDQQICSGKLEMYCP